MVIRKSATFFDDQYKFYKELKSEKLVIAFWEYMFEWINPSWLNSLEQTVFDSLRVRMDNQKQKANAGAKWWRNSRWGWRPQKQTENNEKTTKEQAKNKQKTSKKQTKNKEDKDILSKDNILSRSISRSKSISNNISISKDIETEIKISEWPPKDGYWNEFINQLIILIKDKCNELWIAYDKQKERQYWKLILTWKDFWAFCEKIWQTREEFAINILIASSKIWFWKWICSGPMRIYLNYAEVYNETVKLHNKNQKNLIQSF